MKNVPKPMNCNALYVGPLQGVLYVNFRTFVTSQMSHNYAYVRNAVMKRMHLALIKN